MNWRRFERLEQIRAWMVRRRLHRWVLGLLVVDLVLLGIAYEPLRWWRYRHAEDLRAWTRYAASLEDSIQAWKYALERIETARRERDRILQQFFPVTTRGYQETRRFLQDAARRSGVRVHEIVYNTRDLDAMGLVELRFSLPVTGTYAQVRRFLATIEAAPSFLVLESLRLRSTGRAGVIDVDIGVRTYFRKTGTTGEGGPAS